MLTQAPKGTRDVLPPQSYRWQLIEAEMRRICALAGYREIRTPVFEHTELFLRGVGDTTDIVQKEMYTFLDKGGRSLTLKPEGTAGAARAFIEGRLYAEPLPLKAYYLSSPAFRYDKPQAGRYREHHQFGVEVFGAKDACCDAEIIALFLDVLNAIGLSGLSLYINSIGCPSCRSAYHNVLLEYLAPKLPYLCETCYNRYERNPMRILDCKGDAEKLSDAPAMLNLLCDECSVHFDALKEYLDALGIAYAIDARIVRGLDYYTKTVFEVMGDVGGVRQAVGGGGRYDGLINALGGPPTPGLGFGMGIERLILAQDELSVAPRAPQLYDVLICVLGSRARVEGLKLTRELRAAGIKSDIDHAARGLKAQFKYADKISVAKVLILAEDELSRDAVRIRDMDTGEEREVPRGRILEFL
jgi:histidyl-tRNA synthetase